MNDFENFDQRARRAAADVRSHAAARPRPVFDPADASLLPAPARLGDRRSRRPLLAAAAVVLLVLAGGLALVVRHQGDDDRGPADTTTTTEPPRPFVATDLPRGLQIAGAIDQSSVASQSMKLDAGGEFSALQVYGPSVDDPQLGVGLLTDESNDYAEFKKVEAGGRTVLTLDDAGLGKHVVIVRRDKRAVYAMSPVLDRATLADVAEGAVVNGLEVQVPTGVLPDGFDFLTEEPGPLGPVGEFRNMVTGSLVGSSAVYMRGTTSSTSDTPDGPDANTPVVDDSATVVVRSMPAEPAGVQAARLFADDVTETSIRGHEALVTTSQVAGSGAGTVVRMVTWLERPGELLRVTGYGVSVEELTRTAEGVRPVPADEWADLVERTQLGEFSAASDTPPATELGRGRFADGTAWSLLGRDLDDPGGRSASIELNVAIGGNSDTSTGFSGSGQAIGPGNGEPPEVFSQTLVQQRGGRHFAAGLVRSDVARVELLDEQGRSAGAATMLDSSAGRAWVVELTADPTVLVARAAGGQELDRVTMSNLDENQSPEISESGSPQDTVPSGNPESSGTTAGLDPAPGQPGAAPAPVLPGN